jgi:hypothetical protein
MNANLPLIRSMTQFVTVLFTVVLLPLQIIKSADAQVQQGLPSVIPSAPTQQPVKPKTPAEPALRSMGAAGITGTKKVPSPASAGAALASCWNCGTLISVTDSRVKAKPVWMNSTNPSDVTEASSQTTEKIGDRAPEKAPDKSKAGPTVAGGNIAKPDSIGGLHRRLGFDVTVLMDDGTSKVLVLSMRPAYNIGAKVKVVGNSLMPR